MIGESASGESHIQALSAAIKDGPKLRKKFVSITKEDLFKIVSYSWPIDINMVITVILAM